MVFEVIGTPHSNRHERVQELHRLGFTWADTDSEPYWVDQLVVMDAAVHRELFEASAALWTIFDKAARFVLGRRELYELLSIPEVLWDALDTIAPSEVGALSRYARFDFAISNKGDIRMLELNADTPTGYVEASVATPWMCEQFSNRVHTPNTSMAAHVRDAWSKDLPQYAACVAYGQHLEDSGTIEMLARHSGLPIICVDCLDLWVDDGIVKDGQGEAISSIFALYPKEWMGIDDGGEALAYALETDNLKITNSIHAVILQSKGLVAVIWGLHELQSELFDESEHACIEKYLLPTYNKPVFDANYVSKSMFGREGGSVVLFDAQGNVDVKDEDGFDTSAYFHRVFQKRAELANISLDNGDYHLLTGVFVINSIPCGLLGRAGGLITGNRSHFVAIGVSKEDETR
jgi:glutathionylspermidine synthase